MRPSGRRHAVLLLAIVACISCDASTTTVDPTPPGTLDYGTWYLHAANGDSLPALISDRIAGVAQERTYLDSARLDVDVDGGWVQRYWIRVTLTGILDRSESVYDLGRWSLSGDRFLFASSVRTRTFLMRAPIAGELESTETMLFFVGAPAVIGSYRMTRP